MTRLLVNHHTNKVDRNTRVVTVSNSDVIDAPAYAIAALATAEGVEAPVMSAPASTPAGRALLYVDIADGDLKVRFPNGTVATIASN